MVYAIKICPSCLSVYSFICRTLVLVERAKPIVRLFHKVHLILWKSTIPIFSPDNVTKCWWDQPNSDVKWVKIAVFSQYLTMSQ